MRGPMRVLRQPAFGWLALSYGVNDVGDGVGVTALALLVFDQTGDALATAALFLAGKFVPALLAPALTARVDHVAVRRALPALYAVEAAILATLAATAGHLALAGVLALALVDGTLAIAGRALTRAATAALLEPSGTLREGNAVLNVVFGITSVAGPAAGGLLVAGPGVASALALDAASFVAAAAAIAAARALPDGSAAVAGAWGPRIREGLAYVAGRPRLRALLFLQAVALVFFAAVVPVEVVYVRESLHAGAVAYGAMLGFWGAGMVLGSIVFASLRRRGLGLLIASSTLLIGLAYLGIAAAGTLALAYVASIAGGVGNGVQWVAVVTAVQEEAAGGVRARVLGLLESVAAAMPGLGYLLGGALTEAVSPRLAYAVSGLAVVALVAAGLPAFRMRRRAARARASGPDEDVDGPEGGVGGPVEAGAGRLKLP